MQVPKMFTLKLSSFQCVSRSHHLEIWVELFIPPHFHKEGMPATDKTVHSMIKISASINHLFNFYFYFFDIAIVYEDMCEENSSFKRKEIQSGLMWNINMNFMSKLACITSTQWSYLCLQKWKGSLR